MIEDHLPGAAKHAIDAASIGATVAALAQWLPAAASLLTIVWTLLRIYESPTIQRRLGREKHDV